MATWKKVVVSGSDISQLNNDTGFITAGDLGDSVSGSSAAARTNLNTITGDESAQLLNINSVTISNTQWGYLGGQDQAVSSTDDVEFNLVTSDLQGNVQGDVTGDLTGNADTATTLETARNFSISGDATAAAVSFDGSGNVALSVSLDNDVVDTAEIVDGAVTNAKLAGSIANSKLSNSSITIGDQTTSLGGTVTAFSGSFEGDGSNLTGVVAEAANALTDGNGITDFSYNGNAAGVTVSVEADGSTLTVGASGVKVADAGITATQLATSVAGDGLAGGAGTALSVNVDDSSIETNSDSLRVKAGGITNAMLAGSIANAKLTNSSIDIAGTDVSLGGQVTGDDIIADVSAGEITNAQLSNSSVTIGSTSVSLGAAATTVAGLTLTGAAGSGSFSGSFEGDGSGLTNVPASGIVLATLQDGNGIANFSYNGQTGATITVDTDGSTIAVGSGGIKVADGGIDTTQLADDSVTAAKIATGAVTADAIGANSVTLGTDTVGNYVATLGSGTGVTIGSNTGEGSTPTIAVNYGTAANTAAEGDVTLAVAGTANEIEVTNGAASAIGANRSITVGLPDDVVISGDLTVLGTASFAEETNLAIADRFILLASGSTATGDGGIVVQQATQDVGEVFAFEDNDERWGVATAFNASGNTVTFDAFMAAAVSTGDADPNAGSQDARYDAAGNIFTSTADESIWIYS